MAATITWDEDDEFEAITVESPDDIPDHASTGSTAAAIVSGRNDFHFQEPIWLHPHPADDMQEAGIIQMWDGEAFDVEGVTVFIYKTV